MRPLTFVAVGLALIAVDIRTEHLDLLPDAIGWGLVAFGAWRSALVVPAIAAAATALLTLPEVSLPHHFVMVDPQTGETIKPRPGVDLAYPEQLTFDDLTGWRLAVLAAAVVTGGVALWLLLGDLAGRAAAWERAGTARRLRWLRWLTLALWTGGLLVVLVVSASSGEASFDPVWNGSLELLAMAGIVVIAAVIVVLLGETNRAWAVPRWSGDRSPGVGRMPPRTDGPRPA
ncbi:MAG TPA: hypothetical protein VKD21_09010 [Acidimicrobiales bacterium]|nr:hypothetical protein [Acidimicrobiales bacterium]